MVVQKVMMEGQYVRLEPLAEVHLAGLAQAIEDGELWTNPYTFVPAVEDLPRFLEEADIGFEAGRELAFAIIDGKSGRVAGSTRFRNVVPHHAKAEIGHTFLGASWQRTYVNTETKYLMLRFAFDEWQCQRVEFLTDALNVQSRCAIERLGAKQEGILRSHYRMPGGRIRDTAIYSIVRGEWAGVCGALEEKLLAHEARMAADCAGAD